MRKGTGFCTIMGLYCGRFRGSLTLLICIRIRLGLNPPPTTPTLLFPQNLQTPILTSQTNPLPNPLDLLFPNPHAAVVKPLLASIAPDKVLGLGIRCVGFSAVAVEFAGIVVGARVEVLRGGGSCAGFGTTAGASGESGVVDAFAFAGGEEREGFGSGKGWEGGF